MTGIVLVVLQDVVLTNPFTPHRINAQVHRRLCDFYDNPTKYIRADDWARDEDFGKEETTIGE